MNDNSLEDAFRRICSSDEPLRERLKEFSSAVCQFAPEFAAVYDDLVARLKSADAGSGAPRPGEPMPPFVLPNENNRVTQLAEFIGKRPVVISFNRGHWCEYCQIELLALQSALHEFAQRDALVFSIMPEFQPRRLGLELNDTIQFLCDADNGYALDLGLAIWLGDEFRDLYLKHGIELQQYNRSESWFLPIPATFVVGRDGLIADRFVDPDFRHRMDIDAILSALDKAS
ncbi:MAG: AhpC/TSA family protein [Hyphomicrobium sp.]|nr:MAG: AhpC/TSA family protein [Hyphomicrobium sp.]